jgi:DNA-binding transcriptional regulator YhcF (GntR family)
MIAMGKWPPGAKLPAVRHLESDWSVNRLTVLKAYRMLAAHGLVRHEPNGSFYVAEQGSGRDFGRDRIVLGNLYQKVIETIRSETDLLPLEVLRMFARIAESRMRENPEIAFVECSRLQAADHAEEIMVKLGLPVLPLSLNEIRGEKITVPSRIKVVLTTSFHIDELACLRDEGIEVVALPIEIIPELLTQVADSGREVVFLESDEDLAHRTRKDALWMMNLKEPHVEVVEHIATFLGTALGPFAQSSGASPADTLFLVPQKVWEELDPDLRQLNSVRPISCRLSDSAWQLVAGALRIPFGVAV